MLITQDHHSKIMCTSKNFNVEKLRQAVLLIFGAKLWTEIPGRMRDMYKRKLIYDSLNHDRLDYLDATMITREIKSRNPKP